MRQSPYLTRAAIAQSRRLRREMTPQERMLRAALRETLPHLHFRHQAPLGRYHPDFCSHQARLIIEVDGSQHAEATEYDDERTAFLESRGYKVLRFWNNQFAQSLDGVIAAILASLPSPLAGEGGAKRRMGGAGRRSARAGGAHPLPPPSPQGGGSQKTTSGWSL